MSEDRLDKALEAMKGESVNDKELFEAHDRIWEKLGISGVSLCTEFQDQFRAYMDGQIEGNRRLLLEDHLSRCAQCRAKLAEQRGGRQASVIPMRRAARWPRWGTWAAIAAMVLAGLFLGRASIDTLLAQGPRATVTSIQGNLYLIPEGQLKAGSTIEEGEVVRTGPGSRAVLRLADGSRVDVNERTELSIHATWSGKVITLNRGDVILQAAKQRLGHLQVQTRDSLASVKGTVFAVSAGLSGSLVSVIEGSVAVTQSGTETLLRPGEQAASNPALASSVKQAISWSPDAETYLGILASLVKIEKQVAGLSTPLLTQSRLIQYLPPNTVVFGALPNPGDTISQVMGLVEQQSAENPAFGQWWNSNSGQDLKQLLYRVQNVTPLLGNEIVFGLSSGTTGINDKPLMIFAEIQPGKRNELATALSALGNQPGHVAPIYHLTDTLMVISDSQTHLQWLLANLGQGTGTLFASEIAAQYQHGIGWLLGMDMDSIFGNTGNEFLKAQHVKHLFLERRDAQAAEENSMTITFKGPRMGLASFLANSGSGGAAEYISSDAIAAIYASTLEPHQMFEEMTSLLSRLDPTAKSNLANAEAMLGVNFAKDFAASLGNESAFGMESFSTSGPVWTMAAQAHSASNLEAFIRKLVDTCNAEMVRQGKEPGVSISKEVVDGRTWNTIKFSQAPIAFTWTYDRGYIVGGSDRGVAMRAIANRNGGSSLIWSAAFQQQLPGSAGLHPAGFAWLNTKGAFQGLAALIPNPTIQKLVTERDPILVVFNATSEQIRAVSRTRISGLIMDLMLLQGAGQARVAASQQVIR
jgi:hypothetical protein